MEEPPIHLNIECPTDKTLAEATRAYWDMLKKQDSGKAFDFYLGCPEKNSIANPPKLNKEGLEHPLIYHEIACAQRRQDRWPKLEKGQSVTLVLLIGTSFEPLYQTIWAYWPKRLVLVLNENYGLVTGNHNDFVPPKTIWEDFTDNLKSRLPHEIVDNIEDRKDLDEFCEKQMCVADTPLAIFRHLHERLKQELKARNPQQEVIIDITGAKKTMVAGAYLFAAYTNSKISYVDFDRYDKGYGKAYGYTCRIATVENPIKKLALKQWQAIEKFYGQYDFNAALEVLQQIADEQRSFSGKSVDQFIDYLQALRLWEDGQLREAYAFVQKLQSFGIPLVDDLPSAIIDLYDYWPEKNQNEEWLRPAIFEKPTELVEYVYDELERAKWYAGMPGKRGADPSVQTQARHAFSRAYAVHETLINARLIALFIKDAVHVQLTANNKVVLKSKANDTERHEAIKALTRVMVSDIRKLVVAQSQNCVSVRKGNAEIATVARAQDYNNFASLCQSTATKQLFQHDLYDARNAITHTFVPVTQDHAKKAVELAENNLKDFIDNWAKLLDDKAEADALKKLRDEDQKSFRIPGWDKVKTQFQLRFLSEN